MAKTSDNGKVVKVIDEAGKVLHEGPERRAYKGNGKTLGIVVAVLSIAVSLVIGIAGWGMTRDNLQDGRISDAREKVAGIKEQIPAMKEDISEIRIEQTEFRKEYKADQTAQRAEIQTIKQTTREILAELRR